MRKGLRLSTSASARRSPLLLFRQCATPFQHFIPAPEGTPSSWVAVWTWHPCIVLVLSRPTAHPPLFLIRLIELRNEDWGNTEFAWRAETQSPYICLCWDVKDWLQMGSSHLFVPTDFEKYLKLVWDFNYVQLALLQRQIWFPHLCWFSHSFAG